MVQEFSVNINTHVCIMALKTAANKHISPKCTIVADYSKRNFIYPQGREFTCHSSSNTNKPH